MSYPRKLQILIVEDEQTPIDSYRDLLKAYQGEFPSVAATVARSFADAKTWIESDHIFHLVVLDLNLPMANREPATGDLAAGQQLLDLLTQREAYPVPAVLVVSGKLGLPSLSELRSRLVNNFWYGEMVNKADERLPEELKSALKKAQEYVDVGVHIKDGGRNTYPTLSPPEEDLLRRCVLSQQNCLGVDLEWWGAEVGPSVSRPTGDFGPTKVLMGHFLLDDGLDVSRPTFFKFEPAGNAPFACRDTGILDQKLSHVKVKCSLRSRTRSLLTTQSVTDRRPIPLDRYLAGSTPSVVPHLAALVGDVCDQLNQLGRCSEDEVARKDILWRFHDRGKIERAWNQSDIRSLLKSGHESPLGVYDTLRQSDERLWVTRRSCTHGDLNATNVAVDTSATDRPRAYIFDAAGVHADLATRDLAVLEVTTLLFLSATDFQRHFHVFLPYYSPAAPTATDGLADGVPDLVRNVWRLVGEIRKQVQAMPNPHTYPFLVFDTVLMQLGGLVVQPALNKIASPNSVCMLAAWSAGWLATVEAGPTNPLVV